MSKTVKEQITLKEKINRFKENRQQYRKWMTTVGCLALAVLLVTAGALMLPAFTKETQNLCGVAEHAHTEACDGEVLSCNGAGTKVLTCTTSESAGHSHGESCYDEEGALTCTKSESEGYSHSADCYTEEAHTHDEGCYTTGLVCGLSEHEHTDACKEAVEEEVKEEENKHTEACYDEEGNLTCEDESHAAAVGSDKGSDEGSKNNEETKTNHTEACYDEEGNLTCTDPAHEEKAAEPEKTTHTEACYDEEGNLVCTDPTHEEKAAEPEKVPHTEACYDEEGNLVCTDPTHEEVTEPEKVPHTEDCYDEEGNLICTDPTHEDPPMSFMTLTGELPIDSGSCGTDAFWGIYSKEDGTYRLEITGSGEMEDYTDRRPWHLYQTNISEVVIGSEITHIGNYAFYYMSSLKGLTFEKNDAGVSALATIGQYAFHRCTELPGNLTIPASVVSIGKDAFSKCYSLTSLTFDKNEGVSALTTIGENAFHECSGLTGTLTIPSSVVTIDEDAFSSCSELMGLVFDLDENNESSLTTIGVRAFTSCSTLTGNLFIPKSVVTIGDSAFQHCGYLTGLELETENDGTSALTTIDERAFESCYSIAGTIEIPVTVKNINSNAFNDCQALEGVTFLTYTNGASELKKIDEYVFKNCHSLSGNITIPSSVTEIGSSAFAYSGAIESITIPANSALKTISAEAFRECRSLEQINLPVGLEVIGVSAFQDCSGLMGTLVIPNTVNKLYGDAFKNCSSLTGLEFKAGTALTLIGNTAFQGCSGLTGTLIIPAGITKIDSGAFQNCSGLTGVVFQGETLQTIANSAFNGCALIEEVEIPSSVETIADSAFKNCSSLKKLTFRVGENGKSKLKSLEQNAFYGTVIENLTLPSSVNSITIGPYCFQNVPLETLELGDSVSIIQYNAFLNNEANSKLTDLHIPGNVKTIKRGAFCDAKQLTNLTFAEGVESIGSEAFRRTKIRSLIIPASATSIGQSAFSDCKSLQEVVIKDSAITENGMLRKRIENAAFANCIMLQSVEIGEGVVYIGMKAFARCRVLKTVELPNSLSVIDQEAFSYCNSMETINLPAGLGSIAANAFAFCTTLSTVRYEVEGEIAVNSRAFQADALFDIVIADNISTLTESAADVLKYAKDVYFEGPTTLTIASGAFAGLSSPVVSLSGDVYVDAAGVVYRLHGDGTASLAYCPPGVTSYTVPAVISAGTNYTVTAVDSYAFSLAKNLASVSFVAPGNITKLAFGAFANCKTLTSVNGATSVAGAVASFTNAGVVIGERAFYNTGLTGQQSIGTIVETLNYTYEPIAGSKRQLQLFFTPSENPTTVLAAKPVYRQKTSDRLLLQIYADGDLAETVHYRVYIEYSDPDFLLDPDSFFTVKTGRGTDIPVTVAKSDLPGIYYVDFTMAAGQTLSTSLALIYPSPTSDGGAANVWGEILTEDQYTALGEGGVNLPETTDNYMRAEWFTERTEFEAYKAWDVSTSNLTLKGDGTDSGKVNPSDDLKYKIYSKVTKTSDETYGKDYAKSIDYAETLTLPAGMYWEDYILEAVANGTYFVSHDTSNLYFYAYNSNGDLKAIARVYMSEGESTVGFSNASMELDNAGRPVFKWTVVNRSAEREILASSPINFYILQKSLYVDLNEREYDLTTLQTIHNDVDTTVHYTHSDDAFSHASVDKTVAVPNQALNMRKYTVISSGSQSSPNAEGTYFPYQLRVENNGAIPTSAAVDLEDRLPNVFFIKAEDMQKMFDDVYGRALTIYIHNAALYQTLNLGTATSIDGTSTVKLTPENSEGGRVVAETADIAIAYNSTRTHLEMVVTNGGSKNGTYTIGSNQTYASIQDALDAAGFVVQRKAEYRTLWDLKTAGANDGKLVVHGGAVHKFYVHSTYKTVFQYIRGSGEQGENELGDYDENYRDGGEEYTNNATFHHEVTPNGTINRSAKNYLDREITLNKYPMFNGQLITANKAHLLSLGDVMDYVVSISKRATDTAHKDMPLIDDITGAQVLLAPVEENRGRPWTEGLSIHTTDKGEEYYVLSEPRVYEGVWVGKYHYEIAYADSVTVAENGAGWTTKVCWYLPEISAAESNREMIYQTLLKVNAVDASAFSVSIFNTIWLNDRVGDRLYDNTWLHINVLLSEKNIVLENAGQENEVLDPDDFTLIKRGEEVVYRLMLQNPQSVPLLLKEGAVYDLLPATHDVFAWGDSNVSIEYQWVTSEGRGPLTNAGSSFRWEFEDVATSETGEYKINWLGDITLPANTTLYFYVHLTFPDQVQGGADLWAAYCNKTSGVMNRFVVLGKEETVTHELQQVAHAYLQKGVRSTGHYKPSGGGYNVYGFASRNTYSESDIYNRVVQYYTTVYNAGATRLYLPEMKDLLPEGFTLYSLSPYPVPYTQSNVDRVNEGTQNMTEADNKKVATVVDENNDAIVYPSFTVSATANANNPQELTFKFSSYAPSVPFITLSYDEEAKLYYLQPGQAISFTYTCRIASGTTLPENAINAIALPYYDYNGAGVVAAEGVTVTPPVTTLVTEYNDGEFELWSNMEAEQYGFTKDNTAQWLGSNVALKKEYIIPGITKTAKSYTVKGNTQPLPYVKGVTPTDTVNWEMVITNSGTSTMIDYSIIETMQAPYVFTGDVDYVVYNAAGSSVSTPMHQPFFRITRDPENLDAISIRIMPSLLNPGYDQVDYELTRGTEADTELTEIWLRLSVGSNNEKTPFLLRFYLDEKGNEVMEMQLKRDRFSIPEQHQMKLTLSTANLTDTVQYTVFTNRTVVKPTQSYDAFLVSQGLNLTDENGQNAGVQSSAPINVITGNATSSVKYVTEKDASGDLTSNTAASSDTKNYIVLSEPGSVFNYKLRVHNDSMEVNDAIRKLIFIDNLPEKNDHATFAADDLRGSQFKVSFPKEGSAYAPNFRVVVSKKVGDSYVDTVLGSTDYTVEYSDKTEFVPEDWNGTSTTGWYSTPTASTRSFRVTLEDGDETKLKMPADSMIDVSFDAVVDGDVAAGEIAWNSFGYRYKRFANNIELEAAPLKVGVRVSSAPKLRKSLINSAQDAYATPEDLTFRFLIHEGRALSTDYYSDAAELRAALGENKVTFVDVEVPAGSSASDLLELENLVVYTLNEGTGKWEATADAWRWRNAVQYTILEVNVPEHYRYVSMNGRNGGTYTFTYQSDTNLVLSAVNRNANYGLAVTKVDESGENKLAGAVFGLYTPLIGQKMDADAYAAVLTTYGITPAQTIEMEDKTYYLMEVQATGDNGRAVFETLDQDAYYVVELMAPDGYMLDETPQKVTRVNGFYELKFVNYTMVELPESGS
ncbi:leucine-rich repeat protein, partial [Christensenellaceae bacterium OttesenSCG-928-L17]|nr:leucine-rich repeat protein [Christensenellaceae bacterium OttesenSCG-928-L17]